jgi:hypothetical protein
MGRHGHTKADTGRLPKRRRRRDSGWTIESISEAELGPGMRAASVEEALAALEQFDHGLEWPAVADVVIPLFQRVRPYPPGFPEAARHVLSSGISVTFGIDTGPAFLHVTPEMVEGWGESLASVAERAIVNVRRRASLVDPRAVLHESITDVPVQALQSGTGSASTFVLVPEQLPRLFGHEPQVFLAPMRDLLLSLPGDVDPELAAWLYAEFAMPDPNCLAPLSFRFADGRMAVEALGEAAAIA